MKKTSLQFLVLFFIADVLFVNAPALGQFNERRAPTLTYFATFHDFYSGEFKRALSRFQAEARGSIKTAQSRWIDSICYDTMCGECFYQTGDLEKALGCYNSALQIYIAFYDWMTRVQFPPLRLAAVRKPYVWGVSTRQTQLGYYPSTMLIAQGRIDNSEVAKQGGVIQQAVFFRIQTQEIVRCTALAIRRRMEILGPLCKYDPLTEKLMAALSRPCSPPNHWSVVWVDILRGLVFLGAGKEAQGVMFLQRSVQAAGQFDHPLTSVALLELGRVKLSHGEYKDAAKLFEEATYSAVDYPDQGVLEEAFCDWSVAYLAGGNQGFLAPLLAAWQWAKPREEMRHFRVALALCAAENYAKLGQKREADAMLDDARSTINRGKMIVPRLGANLSFLCARELFQQGKFMEGQTEFNTAIGLLRPSSPWLYQISLIDNRYSSGGILPRSAMDLYNELLRDPRANDWAIDPLDSLAVLTTPHLLSYDNWFEVAWERRDREIACEIADRARRHRFFSSLPLGGRLEALRWTMEASDKLLSAKSQLRRKDLLTHYPHYANISQATRELRAKIAAMPLVPDDQNSFKELSKAIKELSAISLQQEAFLNALALSREPVELIFPPLRSTAEVKKALPDGHAMLIFFVANRRLYAFLVNNSNYSSWQVESSTTLARRTSNLLREMGLHQPNSEVSQKELSVERWRRTAAKFLELLLQNSNADFSKPFDELAIVPDGVLWYVPFEALQVSVDGNLRPLISRFRIRYAPTMSLVVPLAERRIKPKSVTGVVMGSLFPRLDQSVTKAAFDRLSEVLPGTIALKSPLPGPTDVYKVFFDRLIVLDDLHINEQAPYRWTPMPNERSKSGGTLADWLLLPWGSPQEIMLPGYHTMSEDSMKRAARYAPGNDVFYSVCGLMACGTRTLLLSRWRTGGQSAFDLVREFAQELPHTTPAEAWQRAVMLQMRTPLTPEAEPRLRISADEEPANGDHPFFWAGYMLFDSGDFRAVNLSKPPSKRAKSNAAPSPNNKPSESVELKSLQSTKKKREKTTATPSRRD
ncbi:MAG: CHAT domain-containing protein [Thermoguttaceae bacterium]